MSSLVLGRQVPDDGVVELVVGGQGGQATPGHREGEEDLDGRSLPNLDVAQP